MPIWPTGAKWTGVFSEYCTSVEQSAVNIQQRTAESGSRRRTPHQTSRLRFRISQPIMTTTAKMPSAGAAAITTAGSTTAAKNTRSISNPTTSSVRQLRHRSNVQRHRHFRCISPSPSASTICTDTVIFCWPLPMIFRVMTYRSWHNWQMRPPTLDPVGSRSLTDITWSTTNIPKIYACATWRASCLVYGETQWHLASNAKNWFRQPTKVGLLVSFTC